MPTLTVHTGSTVREGETTFFLVELSEPLGFNLWFNASTLKNDTASSARGDYDGFVDRSLMIPAGSTRYWVAVETNEVDDAGDGHEHVGLLVDWTSSSDVTIADTGLGSGRNYATILEEEGVSSGGSTQPDQGYDGGDADVSYTVSNAVAANEGSGQRLRWEFEFYGDHNSYNNPVRVNFNIVNMRTGEVVDDGKRQLAVIDGYEDSVFNWTPPDDDIYNGDYTEYALVVTSMENTSGPTGQVATGRVYDDELPTLEEEEVVQTPTFEQSDIDAAEQVVSDMVNLLGQEQTETVLESNADTNGLLSTLKAWGSAVVDWFVPTAEAYSEPSQLTTALDELTDISAVVRIVPGPISPAESAELVARLSGEESTGKSLVWFSPERLPMSYTPEEEVLYQASVEALQQYILPGDFVDGRLVIRQPLAAYKADGDEFVSVEFTSDQGRLDDQKNALGLDDNLSHLGFLQHSFDWGNPLDADTPVYVVAPTAGEVIFAGNSGTGLGYIVTIKVDRDDGVDTYLTLAHLTADGLKVDTGDTVDAGTYLGEMGGTGGYPVHLHMHAGTKPNNPDNPRWADASEDDGKPGVYMMFGGATIAERHETNSGVAATEGLRQDYGFPIGDTDTAPGGAYPEAGLTADEAKVVSGITSGFTYTEFVALNPEHFSGGDNVAPNGGEPLFSGSDDDEPADSGGSSGGSSNDGGQTGSDGSTPVIVTGTASDDNFTGEAGDQIYDGGEGFDEVKYFGAGSRADAFEFVEQADGSVLATSPDFGQDELRSIEGIWFDEEAAWYSLDELLDPPTVAEVVSGTTSGDNFTGEAGDQIYEGGDGFDEVKYFGAGSSPDAFEFVSGDTENLTVSHAAFGTDTFDNIEGFWFDEANDWMPISEFYDTLIA